MDRRDVKQQHAVLELGAEPVLGDIVVRNPEDEHALARLVLAAVA
jgi:hypothetical protein